MMTVYLYRMVGQNGDTSYNSAWLGLWAFAEISLGITVTGTLLLPKFIEAKGTKLRGIFSSLTRPFTSLTSWGSSNTLMQAKNDTTTPQEVRLDTFTMVGDSESGLVSTEHDQDVEQYSSYEDVSNSAEYPSVEATGYTTPMLKPMTKEKPAC